MHPTLTIAKRAIHNTRNIFSFAFDTITEDTSNIDRLTSSVEASLIEEITKAYPKHSINTPTQDIGEKKSDEYHWIIEPISGLINLSKGQSSFALSIAITKNDKTELALVYQPIEDQLFIASKGDGAKLNDKRIRATSLGKVSPIIATETPKNNEKALTKHLHSLRNLLEQFDDIRQIGNDTLALCYTACGRFDGYYRLSAPIQNMRAALLIAQESGVIVSDLDGSEGHLKTGNIMAGPAKVYKLLLKSIKK